MSDPLRFNGKINSCIISQHGNKFFASVAIEINKSEYLTTHKKARATSTVGLGLRIDLGITKFLSLLNGWVIDALNPLPKYVRKSEKISYIN